ncbi:hypothetical protein BN7_1759 [Wickerhamomyces ciferrii]|uniref:Uncharacterized protein n=1 Tax=Wickerhamomyces ciferrii (strain ATCC 14091 / BCRC 22168 / CBS 111 / JCM 3599 / NBRC 0793 / NRRL Y-1031 F-60-10) TaxID=1206466 RepID=K0KB40_WICCF|nr:uncharacterized protein BN7_1759 [Wickerhamomyces ciferrii]CCH42215.1 hypothetical protein BN7_1759 [Wickerhamomyces ciferrii]
MKSGKQYKLYADDEEKLMDFAESYKKEVSVYLGDETDDEFIEGELIEEDYKHKGSRSNLKKWKSLVLNIMIVLGVILLICITIDRSDQLGNIKNLLWEYELLDDYEIDLDDNFDFPEWIPSNIIEESIIENFDNFMKQFTDETNNDKLVIDSNSPNNNEEVKGKEQKFGQILVNEVKEYEQDKDKVDYEFTKQPRTLKSLYEESDTNIDLKVEYKDRTDYPELDQTK